MTSNELKGRKISLKYTTILARKPGYKSRHDKTLFMHLLKQRLAAALLPMLIRVFVFRLAPETVEAGLIWSGPHPKADCLAISFLVHVDNR